MSATGEKDKDNSVGSRSCVRTIPWVMQSQAKLIHSINKYPLPLLCADIVPSTGDTTGTKHSWSHAAVEKTTRIQLSKQIHDGMTTAKQKLRWPERKGRRDGGRACCAERLRLTVGKVRWKELPGLWCRASREGQRSHKEPGRLEVYVKDMRQG